MEILHPIPVRNNALVSCGHHSWGRGLAGHREAQPELACSAQRVGFFNIGSGRVLEKIPGSGSGSGRVGVLKNTIGYFRVSFLLSGNSGYSGYFRVFRVIHK